MGIEFAQDIFAGTTMRNLGQSFGAIMKRAVGIRVLKFLGQNAADGIDVVTLQRLRPGLLKLDRERCRPLAAEPGSWLRREAAELQPATKSITNTVISCFVESESLRRSSLHDTASSANQLSALVDALFIDS